MAHGDYAGAAGMLSGMPLKGDQLALRPLQPRHRPAEVDGTPRSIAAARAVLDDIGRMPAANEEYRSLRDRANVALGFTALAENRPEATRRPTSSGFA